MTDSEGREQIKALLLRSDALVFDWDDTLVDSKTGKLAQNMDIARQFSVERSAHEVEELYRSGLPLRDMLLELCDHRGSIDDIMVAARDGYSRSEYAKRSIEGAEASIHLLRSLGYRTALFTAVDPEMLALDAQNLGFDLTAFDAEPLHVPSGVRKSNPVAFAPVLQWLDMYRSGSSEAVYVGDGISDMEGSTGAGLQFIGVEQGFVSAAEFRARGALSLSGVQALATIAASARGR